MLDLLIAASFKQIACYLAAVPSSAGPILLPRADDLIDCAALLQLHVEMPADDHHLRPQGERAKTKETGADIPNDRRGNHCDGDDREVSQHYDELEGHDDPTLLRGRAKVKYAVYDMTDKGTCVFSPGPKEFIFPENGAQHVVENETNFKRIYLQMLARDIAKNFYAYDKMDDIATEAVLAQ